METCGSSPPIGKTIEQKSEVDECLPLLEVPHASPRRYANLTGAGAWYGAGRHAGLRTGIIWSDLGYNGPSLFTWSDIAFPVLCVMFFAVAAFLFVISQASAVSNLGMQESTSKIFFPPEIQNSWGAYTPYFSAQAYVPPPPQCTITQVNIIQRHGARFPTSGATARIVSAVKKLLSATHYTDSRLDFLTNYTYSLGSNDLVSFGALQSSQSGEEAYKRYSKLVWTKNLPFVRSSSGIRVVDSAANWTAGFALASHQKLRPKISVILSESLNDTLDDAMCPNAGSSDAQKNIWTSIFGGPIADRLNLQAPGSNLAPADISNLIPLCAFETLATEFPSPFCSLFSAQEFAHFEYFADLDKYYGTGYGQALGAVQGVGYVNELLARLTETPVRDNTQTNRTLDASPITFPLDRSLYADFSHDNQMIAIYAAIGLFKQSLPLDPTSPNPGRTWVTSRLTPFSGRMVTERLSCGYKVVRGRPKARTFVRILVNDAVQPLHFCGADKDGLCALDAFVDSQAYSRHDGEGDFEKCFS